MRTPEACIEILNNPEFDLQSLSNHEIAEIVLPAVRKVRAERPEIEFHPLGMARVAFGNSRHNSGYHLHHFSREWPATGQIETPHTHRFMLNSAILDGVIGNQLWDIAEDGDGEYLQIPVESNPRTTDLLFDKARRVTITPGSYTEFRAGDRYSMGLKESHTSTRITDSVLTLIRKRYIASHSMITTPANKVPSQDRDHYDYPAQLHRKAWDAIISTLEKI